MTHEYTVLTGGVVLRAGPGDAEPRATAVAWAEDTILAVGGDAEVRAISRGDSRFGDLRGAFVTPLGNALEPGAPADFAILDHDPGASGVEPRTVALVRGGRLVEGHLPLP